jgi:hypothetical protein
MKQQQRRRSIGLSRGISDDGYPERPSSGAPTDLWNDEMPTLASDVGRKISRNRVVAGRTLESRNRILSVSRDR